MCACVRVCVRVCVTVCLRVRACARVLQDDKMVYRTRVIGR